MEASRLVRWHVVEIKVHRQILVHPSPGSLKVDHCHLYLPVQFKIASKLPVKSIVANTQTHEGFNEDVFVFGGPLGREKQRGARKVERCTRF